MHLKKACFNLIYFKSPEFFLSALSLVCSALVLMLMCNHFNIIYCIGSGDMAIVIGMIYAIVFMDVIFIFVNAIGIPGTGLMQFGVALLKALGLFPVLYLFYMTMSSRATLKLNRGISMATLMFLSFHLMIVCFEILVRYIPIREMTKNVASIQAPKSNPLPMNFVGSCTSNNDTDVNEMGTVAANLASYLQNANNGFSNFGGENIRYGA